MMTTTEIGAEFIEHHGVLGMHWGVRKAYNRQVVKQLRKQEDKNRKGRSPEEVAAVPTIGPRARSKAKTITKGGYDHPPTPEAITVAVARQKMKKSGMEALTNDELKTMATRMNLEQQVRDLETRRPKKLGEKFLASKKSEFEKQAVSDPVGLFNTVKNVANVAAKVA